MNTPPPNGWTLGPYVVHNEAMREKEKELAAANDRRLVEVAAAKEEGLEKALALARENQTYKDDKAKELGEGLLSLQTALAASKEDLNKAVASLTSVIAPLIEYVNGQRVPRAMTSGQLLAAIGAFIMLVGFILTIMGALAGFVLFVVSRP